MIIILLFIIAASVLGQQIQLQNVRDPSGCVGGLICTTQPKVAVLDLFGNVLVNFTGYASVELGSSPSRSSALYLGNCDYNSCGTLVTSLTVKVPFVRGVATFSNLQIDLAGIGYTFRYFGFYSDNNGFGIASSNPFNVIVGSVYKIAFLNFLGVALGGEPLVPNPGIIAVDHGGNVVTTVNGFSLHAFLVGPNGNERLLPAASTTVSFFNGVAEFAGLYINEAGFPFRIGFNASLGLYTPIIYSEPFRVGVGAPAQLTFQQSNPLSILPIYGGEFFLLPPRINILDAGGNLVVEDSISALAVTINDNPSTGTLYLGSPLFFAKQGIFSMSTLMIDKVGVGYRLKFNLLTFSTTKSIYVASKINLLSEQFNILPGPVRKIYNSVFATEATAGSQPFQVQPVVELRDFGNNIISSTGANNTASVAVTMIPSLAHSARVRVDTTNTSGFLNVIESVTVDVNSGYYGAGELLIFKLFFRYELWIRSIALPTLRLSIMTRNDTNAIAYLRDDYLSYQRVKVLTFYYRVQPGDSSPNLDYNGTTALEIGNSTIESLNTTINFSLPPSTIPKGIIIDTTAPIVVNVSTPTVDDEYGAGEVILFYVRFNFDVSVVGFPRFRLNIVQNQLSNITLSPTSNPTFAPSTIPSYHPSIAFNITNSSNITNITNITNHSVIFQNFTNITTPTLNISTINTTLYSQFAVFTHFLDSKTLVFQFVVPAEQHVSNLTFLGNIILPDSSTKILRLSDQPITSANLSLTHVSETFLQNHKIVINTDPPTIDLDYGVNSTHSSGLFYPGEQIFITIKFTKPIAIRTVIGAINLLLYTATLAPNRQIGFAAYQNVLSDDRTVLFKYTVESNVNRTRLDIQPGSSALAVAAFPFAYIRRKSTIPTTDAIVDTSALYQSGNTLANRKRINIFGYTPFVVSVTLVETHPAGSLNFIPDDFIIFKVKFSGRVLVTCLPVVIIQAGVLYQREAIYLSGNRTDSYFFKYTIEMGDSSNGFNYKFLPPTFCLQSGCKFNSSCVLKADSDTPTLTADPGLPLRGGNLALGIPFTNSSYKVSPIAKRNTTIVSIHCSLVPGSYGAGTVAFFFVTFTDIVFYFAGPLRISPKLYLNFPGGQTFADFSGGSLTKTLVFNFVVSNTTQSIAELLPHAYLNGSTAFQCIPPGCTIFNLNGKVANLSTAHVITPTGVEIDTLKPKIIKVWSDKETSPYDGVYSVGETINIYVQYDKEIEFRGRPPRLDMNTTGEPLDQRFAIYNQALSSSTVLGFVYTVQAGDKTPNLRFYSGKLDLFLGLCTIYRKSIQLVTVVDYTLPSVTTVAVNGSIIAIDTSRIPKITSVVSLNPNGRYGLGETIYFMINFDHPIISTGQPYLQLNAGDHVQTAYCVGVNASYFTNQTNNKVTPVLTLPTAATKVLIFQYVIQLNDFNEKLDYADHFSLFSGLTPGRTNGDLFAASSNPSLSISLDLPKPGALGSVSYSYSIFINGEISYQTGLEYATNAGTYGLNESISIKMIFSKPVYVTGSPSITLNAGVYPRYAVYQSGNLTDTLYFSYMPQPGDYTNELDYAISRRDLSSAVKSFSLNGGSVVTYSNIPSRPAFIHLNPLTGILTGDTNISSVNGIFSYLDLTIQVRGPDYLLRFYSEYDSYQNRLTQTQTLFVSFSNQFELRPKNASKGNQVGWTIAMSGDLCALGAPAANLSVSSVQNLTTSGVFVPPQRQIQLIATEIEPQPAIIKFHTTGNPGSRIDGFFVVTYDEFGPTRPIPADANEDMVSAMFGYDLALLGMVNVTKVPYLGCACRNAFEYTLTFNDLVRGGLGHFRFNTTLMAGDGATIVGPDRVQVPAMLSGGFRLLIDNKRSTFIPYDANEQQMRTALLSIDVSVYSMEISTADASGARSWEITLNVFKKFNEIPLLQADYSELGGSNAVVWTELLRQGIHSRLGLAGNFRIEFRGNTTNLLPYNASAEEVKLALQALPSLGQVNVNRTGPTFILGYTWIIEILQANVATVQGYAPDTIGYIEPLIAHNELIGTDTKITVEILQQSTFGQSAGVVYIFQRQQSSYVEVANIRGTDTFALNQFGFSVALDGDYLIIGAIAAGIQLNTTQLGAAYIFRVFYQCFKNETVCPKRNWQQEDQFFPIGGELEGYGNTVAINLPYAAVSSPFFNNNAGRVYIYTYNPYFQQYNASSGQTKWSFLQVLQANDVLPGDLFGKSIGLYKETLAVGAPFTNGGDGRIVIFKRTNIDGKFAESQNIYPNNRGGSFGFSLATQRNYLVVGSPNLDTSAIYLGKTSQPVATNAGQVTVFQRKKYLSEFAVDHVLIPSNVKTNDQFGYDVSIDNNVIVVGSIENYKGDLLPNKAIISVATDAAYGGRTVSGYFKLYVNFTNNTDSFRRLSTRNIPADVTAQNLAIILQEDLKTGAVLVSRSGLNVFNRAYTWLITFVGQTEAVSLPTADTSGLFGTNATVNVTFVNPSPPTLRGKAHIFQLSQDTNNKFVEQFFLIPLIYQPSDRCGWQVRVSGSHALVACPNRDSIAIPNRNTGAGIVYDLSLLFVEFSSLEYPVIEGGALNVTIQRSVGQTLTSDVLFFISTVDRNAKAVRQTFFKNLFGLTASNLPYPLTYIDYTDVAGKAFARTQYYGSSNNQSRWVDGMYDYRAISDYVPINIALAYLAEDLAVKTSIQTNSDSLLEVPNEFITVGIHAPGIWPSVLGRLYSKLVIMDDGDGLASYDTSTVFTASQRVLQYDEVYETIDDNQVGSTVAIGDLFDLLVSGSPLTTVNDTVQAGVVYCYHKISEKWIEYDVLESPTMSPMGRFGEDVVMSDYPKRNESLLVIGEPGVGTVHIYSNHGSMHQFKWIWMQSLTIPTLFLSQSNFGSKGTLALYGDILLIGSPAVETVYVYRSNYDFASQTSNWLLWESLKSSDYDYDLIFGVPKVHRQGFGSSLAISKRTMVIGSPFADYDKLRTNAVEVNWDTEGTDMIGYGRGKAYVFYSVPTTHTVTIISPVLLTQGTFRLAYHYAGLNQTTSPIQFLAESQTMTAALQTLLNIDSVSVTYETFFTPSQNRYLYQWVITFTSTWDESDILTASWRNRSCSDCVPFNTAGVATANIVVKRSIHMTNFFEQQQLSASDKRSGDRFGGSVAVDGDQVMVGAIYSNNIVTTTWDFEVGTLEGWSKTGTAFDFQPTFADNSRYREVYAGIRKLDLKPKNKPSRMDGRYYIGTYEARPGNPIFYGDGKPLTYQGDIQGDEPIGTLSSEVFLIYGTKISFLIGGGCDYYLEFVELRVDGISVDKVTGKCSERMDRVFFEVSKYYGRAAQIRIVDNSKANWGHINVDDFRFDWDVRGARHNNTNVKESVNGKVEAPLSGAVYSFIRLNNDSLNLCKSELEYCVWLQDAKLSPSDKRGQIRFGSKILLNDTSGVAFISAPSAPCVGFYKESPTVYPYIDENGTSIAAGLHFPLSMSNMRLFESYTTFAPQASGAGGVMKLLNTSLELPDTRFNSQCGAVYVFCKDKALLSADGLVVTAQHWFNVENMRFQAPDGYAGAQFSYSMSMSASMIAIGAPGHDGHTFGKGAVYSYRTAFASLSFAAKEFIALEGTDSFALVSVSRNLAIYSGPIVVGYATSDLTAKGVDAIKYAECQILPPSLRGAAYCGDYRQTDGILIIQEGKTIAGFQVPIVNDLCYERFLKFIEVTISVPGAGVLQGEKVSAKVRIDDDDFIQAPCPEFF